jgi:immune inhibitor A
MRFMHGPPWSVSVERRRIVTDTLQRVNCAKALGACVLVLGCVAPAWAVPTRGELRVLVVLAGFPDRPLARERAHFTGGPDALVDRLVAYYAEVSYGRLRIVPTVGRVVVTVPLPRATYVQRPGALAADALAAFEQVATDPDDRAALVGAQALVVFFAGTGRESHTQTPEPNDPWSNYVGLVPAVRATGGARFDEACVIAEEEIAPFSSFGVLCHEFGHLLGLPELYAPGGLPQEGIGVWGLMGQGTWVARGHRPPHPEAWSKMRLGWVEVETITRTTPGVVLPAVETTPRVVKIPVSPGHPTEYYLLENRARIGADRGVPGEGILVWHVDEGVEGFRSAQSEVGHKLLHLVEADGRGDLDRGHAAGGNRGDATDPWVGPPRWRRWAGGALALLGAVLVAAAVLRAVRARPVLPVLGRLLLAGACIGAAAWLTRSPVCGPGTPGMAPYGGGSTGVVLRRFSPAGPVMQVDVLIAPASPGK